MTRSAYRRLFEYGFVLVVITILAAVIIPTIGHTCGGRGSARMLDASNLRQIGQASLIYAQEHKGSLPHATDVWDYAGILGEILTYPKMWVSRLDPAWDNPAEFPIHILTDGNTSPAQLDPEFRKSKPCFAVALGKLNENMPATMPIAWTRGLQSDGSWAKHSPYGGDGGYIMYLGGNVVFYKNLKSEGDRLLRYDGKGGTSNILEALPPGCLIGEYIPTAEEKAAWATIKR